MHAKAVQFGQKYLTVIKNKYNNDCDLKCISKKKIKLIFAVIVYSGWHNLDKIMIISI